MFLAHGVGSRSDLPVPLWLALYGAAGAILISFFALIAFWPDARLQADAGRPAPSALQRLADAALIRVALRALGVALAVLMLVTAFGGAQDSALNPAPTWFYVWFWVGLAPVSVLFGPVWRLLNPLRTAAGVVRALLPSRLATTRQLPASVGYWPAAAGLLAFAWLELVWLHPDTPATVGWFLTVYGIIHVGAAIVFGDDWFDRCDTFEVCSTLFGQLSFLGRRSDGTLILRSPLAGLSGLQTGPGLVATVSVLLGSTGFDGASRTQLWRDHSRDLIGPGRVLLSTVGLLLTITIVLATYAAANALAQRYAPGQGSARLSARFVHSLIPIAFGYTIAHYFSLVLFQGQVGYLLATDPLHRGWDLLGTGGTTVDYAVVSPSLISFVQVGAIVTGHVLGVIAAHDTAVGMFARRYHRSAQYPMLAAMVAYTIGGIALVVGP